MGIGALNHGEGRSSLWPRIRLLVGIGVSLASLALVLANIEWDLFWTGLRQADYLLLLPAVASLGVAIWLKVLKWELLVRPAGKPSRANLFYAMSIGYLVNTVLPGRLGELARIYLLARLERLGVVTVLSTVAADRILDVVALSLLLAVSLRSADLPNWVGESGSVVGLGAIVLLGICLLLAYPRGRTFSLKLLAASPSFPGKRLVERWAEELCLGMEGLKGIGAQVGITTLTAAIWLATILFFYLGLLAFHIDAPVSAALLGTAVTNLGMVVPSSPGYIGVYQLLVVVVLGAFGVGREAALAFAVVIHVVGLVPTSVAGVYSLYRCGLTLTSWRDQAREQAVGGE